MNLPIPDHLKNYLLIDEKKSTKRKLIATLLCCDNNNFLIKKSQNDLVCIVSAVCTKCNTEIIIFDSRTHGWNADVCNLFSNEESAPFEDVMKKDENEFKVMLRIDSEGIEDFISEACEECFNETGKKFEEFEWVNAFSWITINLITSKRKRKLKVLSYETM